MKNVDLKRDGASIRLENIRLDSDGAVACAMLIGFQEETDARIPAREYRFSRAQIKRMTDYLRSHIGAND